jgi:hypothetical protein
MTHLSTAGPVVNTSLSNHHPHDCIDVGGTINLAASVDTVV